MKSVALGAMLVLMLAACAGDPASPPEPTPTPAIPQTPLPTAAPSAPASESSTDRATPTASPPGRPAPGAGATSAGAFSAVGVLAGDAGLEGGCLWLDVRGERWELVALEGSGIVVDGPSSTVTTAEGTVLIPGQEIAVEGTLEESLASFCQVGPIVVVDAVSAA